MRSAILVLLLPLILAGAFQQAHALVIGSNLDIAGETSPDRQRVEPTIAIDPLNPNIIVVGAQDLRLKAVGGHRWHGYYRSTDGGVTWSSSLLPGFPGDTSRLGVSSPLKRFNATSDPVLAFDGSGNVFYTGVAFNIQAGSLVRPFIVFVARFIHDGADYAGATLIPGQNLTDKPWIAVDTSGGPNSGNVYVDFFGCCTNTGLFTTLFTRSTDGGKTFSTPIPTSAVQQSFPTGLTVDTSGNIFVVSEHAPSGLSPAVQIIVTKSTDRGLTFQAPVIAIVATSIPDPLPGNKFRTSTLAQVAADSPAVYVVFDDFGTGNANVLLIRSTDKGMTWSSPVTVNDVTTGQQFFPTIAVSGGVISVAWYDSRFNTNPGGTISALDLFYARSTDAGLSFSLSVRVTTTSFDPNLVLRTDAPNTNDPFLGDYIDIASSPTAVHPIWTDNRNACDTVDPTFGCVDQDAFTATITF